MNKIKAAREAAGLTQAEVFEALHIPMRTLQDWENDRRTPPEWAERLITEKLSLMARRTKGDIRMAEYMVGMAISVTVTIKCSFLNIRQ